MAKGAGIYLVFIITAVFLVSGSLHALTGSGGGYYFIDSNEGDGPVYSWEDISATGTPLNLYDDDAVNIGIGFPFLFNGTAFSNAVISSNGHIDFTDFTNSPSACNTVFNEHDHEIPWTSTDCANDNWPPNPFIAPWFDDLEPYSLDGLTKYGEVYYLSDLASNPRRFIVQWDAPHFYCYQPEDMLSFQAILSEDSEILFQYRDATALSNCIDPYTNNPVSNGDSATVGLSFSNTTGLQYIANTPAIDDGLAVRFALGSVNLSLTPPSIDFGFVEKGSTGEETITVKNNGSSPLTITSIAPALAPPFSMIENCTGAIPAGESRTITVTFDPDTAVAAAKSGVFLAGSGVAGGFIIFGIAFAGGAGRRRLAALIIAGTLLSGMLLVSCGGGGGDTPPPPGDIVYNQSFDITTDDPLRPTVTVNIRGSSR